MWVWTSTYFPPAGRVEGAAAKARAPVAPTAAAAHERPNSRRVMVFLALLIRAWRCVALSSRRDARSSPSPGTPGEGRGEGSASHREQLVSFGRTLTLTL